MLSRRHVLGLTGIAALGLSVPARAQGQAILIGAPLPLTGPLSPEGQKLRSGYDLWVEAVNKSGGITVGDKKMPVQLVYYDYESNTPKAVQLAEKLITDDKVHFMFGPFGSGASKAVSSVAERYGMPMVASTASSVEVFDQNYKNLFGVLTPNDTLSEPLADQVMKAAPQTKKVAILARNDLYPLALGMEFEKSAKKRGLDVVFFEKYAIGTLDHASSLTQIRAARPDWIIITGYINDTILARKQMSDISVRAPVVTMINGPAYQEFLEATGPLSETLTSATWWHPSVKYTSDDIFKSAADYTRMYMAKYKIEPDYTIAGGSAVAVILQMAIEKAGTLDRDKIRATLASTTFKTFFGPITFTASGQAMSYTPPVFQIQNKKAAVVYPAEIKTGELQLFKR
ncbi:MAG: amino acid ABC transporter substrate-binding protein [Alphaproteobacteria bacterium]|nr:amino acid ABC transporter substrate-binding protein [Alphaproteobacteria bacterium]